MAMWSLIIYGGVKQTSTKVREKQNEMGSSMGSFVALCSSILKDKFWSDFREHNKSEIFERVICFCYGYYR